MKDVRGQDSCNMKSLALSLIISHIPGYFLFYSCNYQVAVASVDIHAVLVILRKCGLLIQSRQRQNTSFVLLIVMLFRQTNNLRSEKNI